MILLINSLSGNVGIVTRRPLVLQLQQTDKGQQEYAEFGHLARRKFTDFGNCYFIMVIVTQLFGLYMSRSVRYTDNFRFSTFNLLVILQPFGFYNVNFFSQEAIRNLSHVCMSSNLIINLEIFYLFIYYFKVHPFCPCASID